jgi:N-acetylmuramoyl-L-alanine amidase
MTLNRNSNDYQTLLKTVYAEARGEDERGQRAVAWVIKNRADLNREYWGGNTIAGVCRKSGQFECWNGRNDIDMPETHSRNAIDAWLPDVYRHADPSGGSDHYNNPAKEGYPSWTQNCRQTVKIGNHQFYKGP